MWNGFPSALFFYETLLKNPTILTLLYSLTLKSSSSWQMEGENWLPTLLKHGRVVRVEWSFAYFASIVSKRTLLETSHLKQLRLNEFHVQEIKNISLYVFTEKQKSLRIMHALNKCSISRWTGIQQTKKMLF